jgi:hypothetical protein
MNSILKYYGWKRVRDYFDPFKREFGYKDKKQ